MAKGGSGNKSAATGTGATSGGSSSRGGSSTGGTIVNPAGGRSSSSRAEAGGGQSTAIATGGSQSCSWNSAPESTDGKGKLTCYWFGQGTAKGFDECPGKYKTACGYCGTETGTKSQSNPYPCAIGEVTSTVEHISTPHFAAFPAGAYGGKNYCGMCVEVTYRSKTITATIVDDCASCPSTGDLDLSLSAAEALGMTEYNGSPNVGVTWKTVGCPSTDDIFVLYNGAKQTNQAYFQNAPFPIATVTYDGKEAQAIGPFWGFQNEMAGKTVTLTDVIGRSIEGTMPSTLPGGSLGVQFPLTCE